MAQQQLLDELITYLLKKGDLPYAGDPKAAAKYMTAGVVGGYNVDIYRKLNSKFSWKDYEDPASTDTAKQATAMQEIIDGMKAGKKVTVDESLVIQTDVGPIYLVELLGYIEGNNILISSISSNILLPDGTSLQALIEELQTKQGLEESKIGQSNLKSAAEIIQAHLKANGKGVEK